MKILLRIFALLWILLGAACEPAPVAEQNDIPTGPGAWIDAPLDGSTIPLAQYSIVSHASDPAGMSTFELKVNGQVFRTDPVAGDQAGQTLAHISQDWSPPAPGTYLLEVRAANSPGEYGAPAFAHVTVEGDSVAPSAGQACTWTALVNVFVREGPGASLYPEITAVESGKTFPVVGQSQDQQFWVIRLQNGKTGYVPKADRFGGVSGDCNVAVLTDPLPPPPTETPSLAPACSDGIDNDGDGKVDFNSAAGLGDPECRSAADNDEANP